jgi:transposase InsO family protein
MVGLSPLVNAEHTHSTGDLSLTMTSMASGRFAPFSHAGPPRSLAKTSSFPRCYGTQFTSSRFIEDLNRLSITHRRTAYHHPESNSYIERFHRGVSKLGRSAGLDRWLD